MIGRVFECQRNDAGAVMVPRLAAGRLLYYTNQCNSVTEAHLSPSFPALSEPVCGKSRSALATANRPPVPNARFQPLEPDPRSRTTKKKKKPTSSHRSPPKSVPQRSRAPHGQSPRRWRQNPAAVQSCCSAISVRSKGGRKGQATLACLRRDRGVQAAGLTFFFLSLSR